MPYFYISSIFFSRKSDIKYETEIYSGKTGLDLPILQLEPLSRNVCASYTGPEGGLMEVFSCIAFFFTIFSNFLVV